MLAHIYATPQWLGSVRLLRHPNPLTFTAVELTKRGSSFGIIPRSAFDGDWTGWVLSWFVVADMAGVKVRVLSSMPRRRRRRRLNLASFKGIFGHLFVLLSLVRKYISCPGPRMILQVACPLWSLWRRMAPLRLLQLSCCRSLASIAFIDLGNERSGSFNPH